MKRTMIDDISRAPIADVLEEDSEHRCMETKSMYTKTKANVCFCRKKQECLITRSTACARHTRILHGYITLTERRGAGEVRPWPLLLLEVRRKVHKKVNS